ncbi:MAG: YbhB/YbcL family Raf kinase inhibitor-like protein [Mycobacteriales bacterium]|nr:YbhB/YbcL family Raf kinase inhibitor-like protein [Frankia sp.]
MTSRRSTTVALACVVGVAALAGSCSRGSRGPAISAPSTIRLTSGVLVDGHLPVQYSCRGDKSPWPLEVTGVPGDARELAVVVEDPDAPRGTFTHWVVYGVAPTVRHVDIGTVPAGATTGKEYVAPCPPGDDSHHYEVSVYALREPSGLPAGRGPADVREAIRGITVAQGRLVALFP